MLDLLVLGGGPAGATLAGLAARHGLRVALVERARFPRDKVCGEFVSAEGAAVLTRLGLRERLEAAGARRIGGCLVTTQRGRRLTSALPDLGVEGRDALGVSRRRLDAELLQWAAAGGVRVLDRCEAVRPIFEEDRVVGCAVRGVRASRRGHGLRARLVVAADGRRSLLVRHLHPELGDPARSGPRSWFGLKRHLVSTDPGLGGRVELHGFPAGYAGLAEIEDGRLNLCLLTTLDALRRCAGSAEQLVARLVMQNPAARERLERTRPDGAWMTIGPLRFGVRRPAAAGALFVGDAAGTIDPFCGEGISHALLSAELALPSVVHAATWGRLDEIEAARYTARWLRQFHAATRRAQLVGAVLGRSRWLEAALGLLAQLPGDWSAHAVAATRTGRLEHSA